MNRRNAVSIDNKSVYETNRPHNNETIRDSSKESYKDEDKKKEIVIEVKEKNYFGYNPKAKRDKDNYYQRIELLNKLSTKVATDKDNNLMNNEINEIYYKYKKKK